MKKGLSEIVCIIDRSGSMVKIRDDAIGGFNAFVADQQKHPGEATMTYVQFDDQYEVVFEGRPLMEVQSIDGTTYVPRGSTALYDAVGRTIVDVGARLERTAEDQRPEQVIVVILTDGHENASREMTREEIKQMITHQQDKYGWQFIYLAANQDAFAEAGMMGIPKINAQNFAATGAGIRNAYKNVTDTTTRFRA
jgi:uncharacterized protein YegL